jgi:hypothetical protein
MLTAALEGLHMLCTVHMDGPRVLCIGHGSPTIDEQLLPVPSPLQDAAGAENPAKRQRQAPQPAQKQQPQQPQQQQPKAKQQQPARLKDASKPAAAAGKARDHSSSGGGVDGMAGSKKTMFYDLLAEQGVVAPVKGAAAAAGPGSSLQAAFLQDLRMERELARKLKVKKVGLLCVHSDTAGSVFIWHGSCL